LDHTTQKLAILQGILDKKRVARLGSPDFSKKLKGSPAKKSLGTTGVEDNLSISIIQLKQKILDGKVPHKLE
jgi:hypothetical protein